MSHRVLLTRIEGAGEVRLQVEDQRLATARVSMRDSRRGFEQLVRGRHFSEVPALVSRVCAICSSDHRVVAARALERALGVTIGADAAALRELLLLGSLIESHALHLFLLVEPDRCGCDSIAELLQIEPQRVQAGLALRELGRQIQEIAGGRAIHPVNVVVGGVCAWPSADELSDLHLRLRQWLRRWPELESAFVASAAYPTSRPIVTQALVASGERLQVGSEAFSVESFSTLLNESQPGYTRAKHYRRPGAPLLCGALARARQAGSVEDEYLGAFANCAAQAREVGAALHAAAAWCEAQRAGEGLQVPVAERGGYGVAAQEAPRGLLLHAYRLDGDGCVTAATIITPTATNQLAMEVQLCADLQGAPDDAELPHRAARIVRAFDPCISCAVHVIRPNPKGKE